MIAEAILKIKSDAQVSVVGNDLDTCTITWHDGNPTDITKEQIKAKINEFAYQEERKTQYGSWESQMEMIYKDQKDGTTTFKDHCDRVRSDNPKD